MKNPALSLEKYGNLQYWLQIHVSHDDIFLTVSVSLYRSATLVLWGSQTVNFIRIFSNPVRNSITNDSI